MLSASSTSPNECMDRLRMMFSVVRNDPYITDQLLRGVEDALNDVHRRHKRELHRSAYGGMNNRNDWICYTLVNVHGHQGLAIYPNARIQNKTDEWMAHRGVKLTQAYLHVNSGVVQVLEAARMVKQFRLPHVEKFN